MSDLNVELVFRTMLAAASDPEVRVWAYMALTRNRVLASGRVDASHVDRLRDEYENLCGKLSDAIATGRWSVGLQ